MLCKIWNMFKVNNKDTRTHKVNNKVNNKDIIDIVLISLLLNLNIMHLLLQCFYCCLWSVNCQLGLLLVVLILCTCWCWNEFRQRFHLWRNYVNNLHTSNMHENAWLRTTFYKLLYMNYIYNRISLQSLVYNLTICICCASQNATKYS